MNTYRVTLEMGSTELVEFLENTNFPIQGLKIEKALTLDDVHTMHPPRRPLRGSKVNKTILDRLAEGPQPVSSLKAALVNAGLSAGSLSTGLAALLKSQEIKRTDDGAYGLAA
jgi:hypothetical protein